MNAPRLALCRAPWNTVLRYAEPSRQTTSSQTVARTIARSAVTRCYGGPAYQSYPLFSNNVPPPPRGEKAADASATGSIPVANETRPPTSHYSSPGSASPNNPAGTHIDASTTLDVQYPQSSLSRPSPTSAPTSPSTSAPATASTHATPTPTTSTAQKPSPSTPSSSKATPSKPRTRPKLRARKAAMKLTPAAVEQLRLMLEGPDPKLIKVGVRNRGCSGLAYHLEWVDKPGSFDEEVVQDGVKVLIDSKALFSIIGSEMDWVEDKLSQRFVFKNPNIKEECGCGESFMV